MTPPVAHITWFKPEGAWVKRIGCLVDGDVRYRCDLWTDDIIETATGRIFRPTSPEAAKKWTKYPLVYDTPGGPLTVGQADPNGVYDGHPEREEWPSSSRKRVVFGPHVFDVDPYDDSLRFAWTNTGDDLRRAIIGMRYFGKADRSPPD